MKMILGLCAAFYSLTAFAQDKNAFYALDAKMNPTVLDSSVYLLWIHRKDDNNWQWNYYYTWGPLLKSRSYADHDGTVLDGPSYLYTKSGSIDSLGHFDHGKKNGSFKKFKNISTDSVIITAEYQYAEDSLTSKKINASLLKNTVDTSELKPSAYPGGLEKWQDYILRQLMYPDRAKNKNIQGKVIVSFTVDDSGRVQDPFIRQSVEYSLDQAAVKLISDSGIWIPGTEKGLNVKTMQTVPVIFAMQH